MSKIDELAEAISGVTSKIDEATNESTVASQEAEETAAVAEALGSDGLVEGLSHVKEQLDALSEVLKGASQQASEIQALAMSLAES
ncbi:hypothetical protein LWF15_01155 [Kineosporia rhizophila]|uniref:hypothetical protein n=1 Tax=Kineosporia rhizophila TaxID=84633 RepID=UPI000A77EFD1|nr:hypothetical protein [Kineosporia rhizophila]MCE0534111.1 hypothetical protein [Kineosporia rhizophila]